MMSRERDSCNRYGMIEAVGNEALAMEMNEALMMGIE
jgi:hypothetical protein